MFGSRELTGFCNTLQERGCLVGSTNSQISKEEKKSASWNVFSFAENAPKDCYGEEVAVIFSDGVQYFPKKCLSPPSFPFPCPSLGRTL